MMAGMAVIPQNMLGTTLNELSIKKALWDLNPEFNFDWGGRLNLWHPYQNGKQSVHFRSKHICTMDRGTIPQAPIWSTKRSMERVHQSDLSYSELTDPWTAEETAYHVDGTESKTGYHFVWREVKDRLLFIGWQATLRKIINQNIPGVTAASLGRKLGVTIDLAKEGVKENLVSENRTHIYDASGRSI
jgi:hypothetical protein